MATYQAFFRITPPLFYRSFVNISADPGPSPENIIAKQIELLPKPRPDRLPAGKKYGDIITDAKESYKTGSNVMVKFYGSNPRHDMKVIVARSRL